MHPGLGDIRKGTALLEIRLNAKLLSRLSACCRPGLTPIARPTLYHTPNNKFFSQATDLNQEESYEQEHNINFGPYGNCNVADAPFRACCGSVREWRETTGTTNVQ